MSVVASTQRATDQNLMGLLLLPLPLLQLVLFLTHSLGVKTDTNTGCVFPIVLE